MYKAIERGYLYEDFLEKSVGFINPNNVEHLCTELGLDNKSSSLIEDLDGEQQNQKSRDLINISQCDGHSDTLDHLTILRGFNDVQIKCDCM